jgi:hypothetical protein
MVRDIQALEFGDIVIAGHGVYPADEWDRKVMCSAQARAITAKSRFSQDNDRSAPS